MPASPRPRTRSAPRSSSCASWRTACSPRSLAEEGLAAALDVLAEQDPRLVPRRAPRASAAAPGSSRPRTSSWPRPARRPAATSRSTPAPRTAACASTAHGDHLGTLTRSRTASAPSAGRHGHPTQLRSGAPVRIVIADDEALLREGLARLLERRGLRGRRAVRRRRGAAAHGRRPPPDVAHRRHPHAARPRRRRPDRRPGDPPPPSRTSACSCSRTTSTRATRRACSRTSPSAPATCSRNASPTSPS